MSSALEAQRLNHWTPRDVSSPGHSEEGKICDMVANQYLCLCAKLRVNRSSTGKTKILMMMVVIMTIIIPCCRGKNGVSGDSSELKSQLEHSQVVNFPSLL